ncbi:hypothetical protein LAZ67_7002240 [Cordylochernes scorpioides]|uniref:Copia protein n=1 Tax=Cordylochernes scorpioides TaxID=51811 RepID=A0ABY6KN10_9ARAC|nr:hypothetical protein LAZ67_7002240 [Cordylochernes scorpioides]
MKEKTMAELSEASISSKIKDIFTLLEFAVGELNDLKTEIQGVKEDLYVLKKEGQNISNILKSKVQDVKVDINSLRLEEQKYISNLNKKIKVVNDEQHTLNTEVRNIKGEIGSLKMELKTIEKKRYAQDSENMEDIVLDLTPGIINQLPYVPYIFLEKYLLEYMERNNIERTPSRVALPDAITSIDSDSKMISLKGTMTAQRYVDDVLGPVTLPYLQGVPNALYQQDNARPHTARISQQALQDVQMLPWPPYSPDLSPIEHIIGRRLHALPQPRSEDELWQMFRLLLEQNQLLDIVDGEEIKPEALELRFLEPLMSCKTAAQMWTRLMSIHEQRSEIAIGMLWQQFFDARMSSSEDVSSYIAKIENLSARIQDAGGTITDDQKVAKIINSLPSSMRYFIPAWESQAPITQTLENLSARLLIEECRNQQADSSQGTAFYQQTKPRIKEDNIKKTDSGKISELKKKTECHYCHKIGHWSQECRKRIADQQKKNEKRKNQAGDYDHKGFNADTFLKWNDCDIWWADSGASCSMTFRREWFKSFTPIHNDHRIYLGDNTSVLAEGTGDIEILAMVNGKWIATSIRNVLYSSKLKKNLFSLGVCTEKGYRVDIDKDELRIYSRKDLKAVGQRQDGLYKMMFRVTSSSQGFSAKINNLQLWHERLAHISLTTIREMAKNGLINGLQPEDIKEDDFFCQGCQEGKAHRKPSHLSETKEYNPELTGYSDSDYARDIDSRKSTTGYIFMLNHGAVSWSSQKQSTVALSTTESEYIAACAATKEMVWLRRLLKDIGIKMDRPTVLNMDNQAAIKLVQNPEFHKRTKHIDVRYHYIRTKQEDGELITRYVSTLQQTADLLTKPLGPKHFRRLLENLNDINFKREC